MTTRRRGEPGGDGSGSSFFHELPVPFWELPEISLDIYPNFSDNERNSTGAIYGRSWDIWICLN